MAGGGIGKGEEEETSGRGRGRGGSWRKEEIHSGRNAKEIAIAVVDRVAFGREINPGGRCWSAKGEAVIS